jgi:hypothetical protein
MLRYDHAGYCKTIVVHQGLPNFTGADTVFGLAKREKFACSAVYRSGHATSTIFNQFPIFTLIYQPSHGLFEYLELYDSGLSTENRSPRLLSSDTRRK